MQYFTIFCNTLPYVSIFYLLIHPVRCQFREYVLLFQPSPASGAGGEWQARVALALTDQSQPASERPSAERYGLPVLFTWEWGLTKILCLFIGDKIRKTWINMAGILIHIIENLEIRVG